MRDNYRRHKLSVQTSAMCLAVRHYYHAHHETLPPHVPFPSGMRLCEFVIADVSVLVNGLGERRADPYANIRCLCAVDAIERRQKVIDSFGQESSAVGAIVDVHDDEDDGTQRADFQTFLSTGSADDEHQKEVPEYIADAMITRLQHILRIQFGQFKTGPYHPVPSRTRFCASLNSEHVVASTLDRRRRW
jgi:hypothetical protein